MPDTCPICGKPPSAAANPFCGTRCANVDLGRWLTGQYCVPGPPADRQDDEAPAQTPARGREAGA